MGRVARRTLRRVEVTKPVPGPITGLGCRRGRIRLIARLRKFLNALDQTFWVVPALIVLEARSWRSRWSTLTAAGPCPNRCSTSAWLYNSGGTGARTLLGAVASSTVRVAGTVFSIMEFSNCCASNYAPRRRDRQQLHPIPPVIAPLSSEKANGNGA